MRAMWLGELVAIECEEYAAVHPAEISRRRFSLGGCRNNAVGVAVWMRPGCKHDWFR